MFLHQPLNFPTIERTEIDGLRHYVTPNGNVYPSVTTVLSSKKDPGLQRWIDSVGQEAANKRMVQGANRGNGVHKVYEDFVNNDFEFSRYDPITYDLFKKSKKHIEEGITLVYNLEVALYSDRLKSAGTCDSLCQWKGVNSVLDYKTAYKPKKREWITDYFYQTAAYAMMVFELTGIVFSQLVIIIINEQEYQPQIFVERTADWIEPTIKFFSEYHKNRLT